MWIVLNLFLQNYLNIKISEWNKNNFFFFVLNPLFLLFLFIFHNISQLNKTKNDQKRI